MAFPMAHLWIAYNILSSTDKINKPSDFMLGALAPDSVHYRDNYDSSMKRTSHLCIGDEKWGEVTNNAEWTEHVLEFLDENKDKDIASFAYGYCCHILTDIQNNIKIWIPFRSVNTYTFDKWGTSDYHEEARRVDQALYSLCKDRTEIWKLLEQSEGYDISGIVQASDTNAIRDSILKQQYQKPETADLSNHRFTTVQGMLDFIANESEYVKEVLGL